MRNLIKAVKQNIDFKTMAVAGLLASGSLKGNEGLSFLPIDLTLLMACLCAMCVVYRLIRSRGRVPRVLAGVGVLFLLFTVGAAHAPQFDYANEKVIRLFTLTLLAATAPVILFRSVDDLRKFLNAGTIFASVLIINALFQLVTNPSLQRLAVMGGTTITLAQKAGMAVLWILLLGLQSSRARYTFSLMAILPVIFVLYSTGSRGPMIAIIAAITLVMVLVYSSPRTFRTRKVALNRMVILCVILYLIFSAGIIAAPSIAQGRIAMFLSGDIGTSGEARTDFYSKCAYYIAGSPIGAGWGGFASVFGSTNTRAYPHNLVLEVFMESGWLAGLFLVGFVCTAMYKSFSASKRFDVVEFKALFAWLVFFTVAACISGDVNDNRCLFALVPLCCNLIYIAKRDLTTPAAREHLQSAAGVSNG